MKQCRWIYFGILASFLSFAESAFCSEPILIGVLDEKQQCDSSKVADERALIMFAKAANGWISLDSEDFPDIKVNWNHKWTVAFDGRSLGTVNLKSVSPSYKKDSDWFYPGELWLAPIGKFPSMKNASKSFGGWCDTPKFRPLVLVSKSNVKDPAGWKPFKAGAEYKEMLFESLSNVLKREQVVNCRNPEQEKADPYAFKTEDLRIIAGYRSTDGSILISIGLNPENYHCDGPMDAAWLDHWFRIRNSQIDFIGEDLQLIDAGDYDADGTSEVMFWSSGYNKDGYVLYYDDLLKRVEFKWNYH